MPSSEKELWLFTARFPKGHGEFSLEHELPHLCRHFKRVLIFPLLDSEGMRPIPKNAEVVMTLGGAYDRASLVQMLVHHRLWTGAVVTVFRSAPSLAIFLRRSREVFNRLAQAVHRTLLFRRKMLDMYDPDRVVMYSNWAEDWSTVLGMCRTIRPGLRFVTRLRGFDLYDHRARDGWQMFQRYNLEQASHIYTTSKAGTAHILGKFPHLNDRISISPTATVDHGIGPWRPSEVFRLVSCSNLYPIKRVPLIAEALQGITVPVHWTHFGDGADRNRLEQLAARFPAHVTMDLKGAVPNAAVIDWYMREPVDLFIHMSSTEGGVAVVLQEAASFGIPLLAADAGGVGEIVNGTTGELLPHDPTPELIRGKIEAAARCGVDTDKRAQVRAFWKEHFHAEVVHERFAVDLLGR